MPQPHGHGGHLMAGAKARRGAQRLGPSMLDEGHTGNNTPSAPWPNPIPQFPLWGNCRPFPPSVSQPGGPGGGEQEAPEPPYCPYKDSTALELLPPAQTPGPAPHLPLYHTSPSLPYIAFFTPHQPPSSHSSPSHPPTSAPLPHINPSHHLPIPTSAPHHPLNTWGSASQRARISIEFLSRNSPQPLLFPPNVTQPPCSILDSQLTSPLLLVQPPPRLQPPNKTSAPPAMPPESLGGCGGAGGIVGQVLRRHPCPTVDFVPLWHGSTLGPGYPGWPPPPWVEGRAAPHGPGHASKFTRQHPDP